MPGLPAVDKSVEERLSGHHGYARHRACCRGSHVDRRARAGGAACAGRASQGRARRGSRASGTALDRTTAQLGNGSAHPQLTRGNALREAREYAAAPLPAQTPRRTTPEALIALEFRGRAVHDSVHAWLATAWHARFHSQSPGRPLSTHTPDTKILWSGPNSWPTTATRPRRPRRRPGVQSTP